MASSAHMYVFLRKTEYVGTDASKWGNGVVEESGNSLIAGSTFKIYQEPNYFLIISATTCLVQSINSYPNFYNISPIM